MGENGAVLGCCTPKHKERELFLTQCMSLLFQHLCNYSRVFWTFNASHRKWDIHILWLNEKNWRKCTKLLVNRQLLHKCFLPSVFPFSLYQLIQPNPYKMLSPMFQGFSKLSCQCSWAASATMSWIWLLPPLHVLRARPGNTCSPANTPHRVGACWEQGQLMLQSVSSNNN